MKILKSIIKNNGIVIIIEVMVNPNNKGDAMYHQLQSIILTNLSPKNRKKSKHKKLKPPIGDFSSIFK